MSDCTGGSESAALRLSQCSVTCNAPSTSKSPVYVPLTHTCTPSPSFPLLLSVPAVVTYRRLFASLREEATRTEEILRLLPQQVVESSPKLLAFFTAGGGEIGGKGGAGKR